MAPHERNQGIRVLLDDCLNLSQTDELLVIYDESFFDYMSDFASVVTQCGYSAAFIYFPLSYQLGLLRRTATPYQSTTIRLPAPLRVAMNASTAILNVLDGGMATTSLRRAIVQQPRSGNCRFAHVPGISDDILNVLATSPIPDIVRDCESVALILGNAAHATLRSTDSNGISFALDIPLHGWATEPIMSPGVILPGSWGNIPPGETFTCPTLTGINGSVCINGSVPGAVLDEGQEIVLDFVEGRLVDYHGDSHSPGIRFLDSESQRADRERDPNWNAFAELGIGLNPALTALTGNPLFDEKVAGTIHVALGDNTCFGRPIAAALHADMVICHATLLLDDIQLVARGTLTVPAVHPAVPESALDAQMTAIEGFEGRIAIREAKVANVDGCLMRRLTSAYRVGLLPMADEPTSRALADLSESLLRLGSVSIGEFLVEFPNFNGIGTGRLLALLSHFDALAFSE